MCVCIDANEFLQKTKRRKRKKRKCGGREAGHLGAERSFSTNTVAHTLHLPPTRTKGERAKRQKGKKIVLLAEQPNMKVKRQGEKVELAQGGNYTVQKIYSNKNKTTGRETIQEICPQERKTSKEIIKGWVILFLCCLESGLSCMLYQ